MAALKNSECPLVAGSVQCLDVVWGSSRNLCQSCPWWDEQCAEDEDDN